MILLITFPVLFYIILQLILCMQNGINYFVVDLFLILIFVFAYISELEFYPVICLIVAIINFNKHKTVFSVMEIIINIISPIFLRRFIVQASPESAFYLYIVIAVINLVIIIINLIKHNKK